MMTSEIPQPEAPPHDALRLVNIGVHQLAVPGKGEAGALIDWCPRGECAQPTAPAGVLQEVEPDGWRLRQRVGIYRCLACGAAWLCCWDRAARGKP